MKNLICGEKNLNISSNTTTIDNSNIQIEETGNNTVNEFIGGGERADDLSFVEVTMVDQNDFEGTNELPVKKSHQGPSDWAMTYDARPDTLREFNPLPMLQQIMMDLIELAKTDEDAQVIVEKYNIRFNPPTPGVGAQVPPAAVPAPTSAASPAASPRVEAGASSRRVCRAPNSRQNDLGLHSWSAGLNAAGYSGSD